jgi:hypothetical protein
MCSQICAPTLHRQQIEITPEMFRHGVLKYLDCRDINFSATPEETVSAVLRGVLGEAVILPDEERL